MRILSPHARTILPCTRLFSARPSLRDVIQDARFRMLERTVAALEPTLEDVDPIGVDTTMEIKPIKNEDYESAEIIDNPMEARSNKSHRGSVYEPLT